jgi:hypothetical protein
VRVSTIRPNVMYAGLDEAGINLREQVEVVELLPGGKAVIQCAYGSGGHPIEVPLSILTSIHDQSPLPPRFLAYGSPMYGTTTSNPRDRIQLMGVEIDAWGMNRKHLDVSGREVSAMRVSPDTELNEFEKSLG